MRYYNVAAICGLFVIFTACSTSGSRWRDSAFSRYNTALTAGSGSFAPEETENIRQTLELADRHLKQQLVDQADSLYQLACQKSQLLYRNLILSKIHQGSIIRITSQDNPLPREIILSKEYVSIQELVTSKTTNQIAPPNNEPAYVEHSFVLSPVIFSGIHDSGNTEDSSTGVSESFSPEQSPVSTGRVDNIPMLSDKRGPIETTAEITDSTLNQQPGLTKSTIINTPSLAPNHTSQSIQSKKLQIEPTLKSHQEDAVTPVNRTFTTAKHPIIYLTFDDGPSRLTLPIATYLKSLNVPATFFVLGNNIKGHEKQITATIALGHRIGNHTFSHNLKKLNASLESDSNEITKTASIVNRLGGNGNMVRIPYGAVTKKLTTKVASEGGQVFDWDINSNDSTKRGAHDHTFIEQTVMSHLRKNNKKHIILLFHDGAGHDSTLTAIRHLVPKLKQEGYTFGLLSSGDRVARVIDSGTVNTSHVQ